MTNAQSLRIVRPLPITPAMLVDSNVLENDYPEYSAAAPYALGVRVMVTAQHSVYEAAAAVAAGESPTTSSKWTRVGPTNKWKAFDQSNSSQTARPQAISYRIHPGRAVQAFAALNLQGAKTIRARVVDPVLGTIYDVTRGLTRRLLQSSWWNWFYGEREAANQIIFTDLPAAPSADIYIDLVGTDELAVGVLMVGSMRSFGLGVQLGARIGITDYSTNETNKFGDAVLVQRNFSRRANWAPVIRATEVDAFVRFMADVRAVPCLWIGGERYECMAVFGPYKNFEVLIAYFNTSTCDLQIEGLT
jgi:hypothetical protein